MFCFLSQYVSVMGIFTPFSPHKIRIFFRKKTKNEDGGNIFVLADNIYAFGEFVKFLSIFQGIKGIN